MGLGVTDNRQMSLDAKVKTLVSRVIDLSASIAGSEILLYDRERALVIPEINIVYIVETAAAASLLNIGTLADADAVVDDYSTSAVATAGTVATVTLATTLVSSAYTLAYGKPVLPKNTPLFFTHTASGGAGIAQLVLKYYAIDQSNR